MGGPLRTSHSLSQSLIYYILVFSKYYTSDKFPKARKPECNTLSSQPYRIAGHTHFNLSSFSGRTISRASMTCGTNT
jgi:hypothetical protein